MMKASFLAAFVALPAGVLANSCVARPVVTNWSCWQHADDDRTRNDIYPIQRAYDSDYTDGFPKYDSPTSVDWDALERYGDAYSGKHYSPSKCETAVAGKQGDHLAYCISYATDESGEFPECEQTVVDDSLCGDFPEGVTSLSNERFQWICEGSFDDRSCDICPWTGEHVIACVPAFDHGSEPTLVTETLCDPEEKPQAACTPSEFEFRCSPALSDTNDWGAKGGILSAENCALDCASLEVVYSDTHVPEDATGEAQRQVQCFLASDDVSENSNTVDYYSDSHNYCLCDQPDECDSSYTTTDASSQDNVENDNGPFSDMETLLAMGVDPACSILGAGEPTEAVLSTLPFTFDVECIPAMDAVGNAVGDSMDDSGFGGGNYYTRGPETCNPDGREPDNAGGANIGEICSGKCGVQVANMARLGRHCFGELIVAMSDVASEDEMGMLMFVSILSIGAFVSLESACIPDGNGGFCADYDGPLSMGMTGEELSGDECAAYAGNCCATAKSDINLLALLPVIKANMEQQGGSGGGADICNFPVSAMVNSDLPQQCKDLFSQDTCEGHEGKMDGVTFCGDIEYNPIVDGGADDVVETVDAVVETVDAVVETVDAVVKIVFVLEFEEELSDTEETEACNELVKGIATKNTVDENYVECNMELSGSRRHLLSFAYNADIVITIPAKFVAMSEGVTMVKDLQAAIADEATLQAAVVTSLAEIGGGAAVGTMETEVFILDDDSSTSSIGASFIVMFGAMLVARI